MYFEGDPLIPLCPIVKTIPDPEGVKRLIAPLDINAAVPMDCLACKIDIVLRGRRSMLFENRLKGNTIGSGLELPEGNPLADRRALCAYRQARRWRWRSIWPAALPPTPRPWRGA